MCSNLADWLEDEVSEVDLAKKPGAPPMLESFLHSTPADLGTLKLQVSPVPYIHLCGRYYVLVWAYIHSQKIHV
jgi:hypothetical protein